LEKQSHWGLFSAPDIPDESIDPYRAYQFLRTIIE
jgi:hypothetical protein